MESLRRMTTCVSDSVIMTPTVTKDPRAGVEGHFPRRDKAEARRHGAV